MSKDYYKILDVEKSSSPEEIKKAFRKKAHEYHPDKKGGDEAKFKEINEAYQILSNEQKRKQYDQFGDSAFSGQGFGGTGMNWDDFARAAASAQGGQAGGFSNGGVEFDLGDIFGGLGDIFGMGSARGGRGKRRGADIQTEITIEFKEAVFGVEKEFNLHKTVTCNKCNGNKAEPGTPIETCQTCKGQGSVIQMQRTILGSFQARTNCPDCQSEGKTAKTKCKACHGTGLQKDTVKINVRIPAGIDDNQTIRLQEQGEASIQGTNGDLYIKIRVKADDNFERDGVDILSDAQISFSQAALGDKIPVETVEGEVTLKIPAGTQSGTVFKLRGKGAHSLHSSGRGDQLVRVIVKTPDRLSRAEKKLFEELRNS